MGKLARIASCSACQADIFEGEVVCQMCGTPFTLKDTSLNVPKSVSNESSQSLDVPNVKAVYIEPPSAFATGLPEWSVEPPAVVVRRKVKI